MVEDGDQDPGQSRGLSGGSLCATMGKPWTNPFYAYSRMQPSQVSYRETDLQRLQSSERWRGSYACCGGATVIEAPKAQTLEAPRNLNVGHSYVATAKRTPHASFFLPSAI